MFFPIGDGQPFLDSGDVRALPRERGNRGPLIAGDGLAAGARVSKKGAAKRVALLNTINTGAPGQKMASAKGTLWGAVNAVTYYLDHVCKSKSDDARLDKAWFGDNRVVKARAVDLAKAIL